MYMRTGPSTSIILENGFSCCSFRCFVVSVCDVRNFRLFSLDALEKKTEPLLIITLLKRRHTPCTGKQLLRRF